jgi:hypothetical protein
MMGLPAYFLHAFQESVEVGGVGCHRCRFEHADAPDLARLLGPCKRRGAERHEHN